MPTGEAMPTDIGSCWNYHCCYFCCCYYRCYQYDEHCSCSTDGDRNRNQILSCSILVPSTGFPSKQRRRIAPPAGGFVRTRHGTTTDKRRRLPSNRPRGRRPRTPQTVPVSTDRPPQGWCPPIPRCTPGLPNPPRPLETAGLHGTPKQLRRAGLLLLLLLLLCRCCR